MSKKVYSLFHLLETDFRLSFMVYFFNSVSKSFLPIEIMFVNNLYAPGTPAGNSLKNDKPV